MYVYWESICQDLDGSPFVFCSWGGGFEEFADGLSTGGVSDEEVCGFCGCDRFYLGVFFGGWWVCFVEVLDVVFESFLSCFPCISLKGVSSLFSGGSTSSSEKNSNYLPGQYQVNLKCEERTYLPEILFPVNNT